MQAVVYRKSRGGKVLAFEDLEPPVPGENEVVVTVRAASVNPLDWRLKAHRPGVDLAGHVSTVGKAVTAFRPGDAVFGTGKGAFAESALAPASSLILKPEFLSFEQAAAIPIAGLTALQGLRDHGRLHARQKILIIGSAGGVGTFSVQIAKALGARVTAVCSTKNADLVRTLGAERIVDYTQQDLSQCSERFDLILDNVGNRPLLAMKSLLQPAGRCVLIGAPKSLLAMLGRIVGAAIISLFPAQKLKFFVAKVRKDDLGFLCTLIQQGKVTPVIDRQYPLADAAAALAYVEAGHARAKVVLIP